jgi:hypothetical protein
MSCPNINGVTLCNLFPCIDTAFLVMDFLDLGDQVVLSHTSKSAREFFYGYCRYYPETLQAVHFMTRMSARLQANEQRQRGLDLSGSLEDSSEIESISIEDLNGAAPNSPEDSSLQITQPCYQAIFSRHPSGSDLELSEAMHGLWFRSRYARETSIYAAREGHLPVLVWLRNRGVPPGSELVSQAAVSGDCRIVQFCHEWHGGPLPEIEIMHEAARHGCLRLLQWMVTEKGVTPPQDLVYIAAVAGKLGVVRWARRRGLPWNSILSNATQEESDILTLLDTAVQGHSKVVKWCHQHNCPGIRRAANAAAGSGKIHLMRWCIRKGARLTDEALIVAARYNRKFSIVWCLAYGCRWTPAAFTAALRGKHYELMKWMFRSGCPIPRTAIEIVASTTGNVEVAQWLHNNGAPIPADAAALAIENGFSDLMEWVMDNEVEVNNVFEDPGDAAPVI